MKIAIMSLCLATLALAGCRRETPVYEPMKLGGHVEAPAVR